jgi:hypothetical protein
MPWLIEGSRGPKASSGQLASAEPLAQRHRRVTCHHRGGDSGQAIEIVGRRAAEGWPRGWGDVGTLGSARFAQAAIAHVGQAIAIAVGELVQALFEAVLPC